MLKKKGGSCVEIIGSKYDITPELQEVFTKTKGILVQKLSDKGKINIGNILNSLKHIDYIPKRRETSSQPNYDKYDFDNDKKILITPTNEFRDRSNPLQGEAMKISNPSNLIDN